MVLTFLVCFCCTERLISVVLEAINYKTNISCVFKYGALSDSPFSIRRKVFEFWCRQKEILAIRQCFPIIILLCFKKVKMLSVISLNQQLYCQFNAFLTQRFSPVLGTIQDSATKLRSSHSTISAVLTWTGSFHLQMVLNRELQHAYFWRQLLQKRRHRYRVLAVHDSLTYFTSLSHSKV